MENQGENQDMLEGEVIKAVAEEEKGEELLKEIKDNLDAIYMYINMNLDSMTEEDKKFWINILEKIDKDFYENKDTND
jgi:NTP pyrophosphatase (non-canonical NTP hydrolase)